MSISNTPSSRFDGQLFFIPENDVARPIFEYLSPDEQVVYASVCRSAARVFLHYELGDRRFVLQKTIHMINWINRGLGNQVSDPTLVLTPAAGLLSEVRVDLESFRQSLVLETINAPEVMRRMAVILQRLSDEQMTSLREHYRGLRDNPPLFERLFAFIALARESDIFNPLEGDEERILNYIRLSGREFRELASLGQYELLADSLETIAYIGGIETSFEADCTLLYTLYLRTLCSLGQSRRAYDEVVALEDPRKMIGYVYLTTIEGADEIRDLALAHLDEMVDRHLDRIRTNDDHQFIPNILQIMTLQPIFPLELFRRIDRRFQIPGRDLADRLVIQRGLRFSYVIGSRFFQPQPLLENIYAAPGEHLPERTEEMRSELVDFSQHIAIVRMRVRAARCCRRYHVAKICTALFLILVPVILGVVRYNQSNSQR